jgi:uroporphyrinogen-III synthase
MRVLVTRPQPQADDWVARLRASGIDALALPLIDIAPAPEPRAVAAAWASLASRSLVVFVSPTAAERFMLARPPDAAWPATLPAASIGPGTTQALRDAGIDTVIEPAADAPQFDSEALWTRLSGRDWRGTSMLLVRGDGGRDWLARKLQDAGAAVEAVTAYARRAPGFDDAATAARLARALAQPQSHCWLFSSSEAIDHLATATPAADWSRAHALATHPRIAERARALGIAHVVQTRASFEAVWSALRR